MLANNGGSWYFSRFYNRHVTCQPFQKALKTKYYIKLTPQENRTLWDGSHCHSGAPATGDVNRSPGAGARGRVTAAQATERSGGSEGHT